MKMFSKKSVRLFSVITIFLIAGVINIQAQVGINTTDPNGVLDINTSTMGIVYPNVALLATDNPSPVINPQGGAIVPGTVVYNTNTTATGNVTDVHPGIYVWDGTMWTIHYKKRQSGLHAQTGSLRTESNFAGDWQDIPGLGVADAKTFVPSYSGTYKIIIKTNYGGGDMINNGLVNVAVQEGTFRFSFNASTYLISTTAYSIYNPYVNGGTFYSNIWKESYITKYVNLTAGVSYSFSLEFDQLTSPGFFDNGNSGVGRGYIGTDIPCTIEFTYMDE